MFIITSLLKFCVNLNVFKKAGSNGVGSDYQPFHYFIGGDGTCSEEVTMNENLVDEQLDKAIDSIEDNLSPTYVGASYSNYNATLSFIFAASFNTAVDLGESSLENCKFELCITHNRVIKTTLFIMT